MARVRYLQVQDIEFVVNMVSPIPKFIIKNPDKMFTGSNKESKIFEILVLRIFFQTFWVSI